MRSALPPTCLFIEKLSTVYTKKRNRKKNITWETLSRTKGNSVPRAIVPATGSRRKYAGKSPDPSGKRGKYLEHESSIPAWNFRDFFRWFPDGSCRKAQEFVGIHGKKSEKILDRNTASNYLVFSVASRPFPVVRRSLGIYHHKRHYLWTASGEDVGNNNTEENTT